MEKINQIIKSNDNINNFEKEISLYINERLEESEKNYNNRNINCSSTIVNEIITIYETFMNKINANKESIISIHNDSDTDDELENIDIEELMIALIDESNDNNNNDNVNKYIVIVKIIIKNIFSKENYSFVKYVSKYFDFEQLGNFIMEHKKDIIINIKPNVMKYIIKQTIEVHTKYNDILRIYDIYNLIKLVYKNELNNIFCNFQNHEVIEQMSMIGCSQTMYLLLKSYNKLSDMTLLYKLNDHASYYCNKDCKNIIENIIQINENINDNDKSNDCCVLNMFCFKARFFY